MLQQIASALGTVPVCSRIWSISLSSSEAAVGGKSNWMIMGFEPYLVNDSLPQLAIS